ncbi:hypothetical protein ABAZ39_03465 [Azospirillum argentinense]|uniref:Uncharacterized protein n=1 Tax=Azospirillum argentinense TaxID=2970906 RepID=A0A060DE15_9PROT|nr:hypothetical protein [Azospirillum argentinense]AIB11092.1 hypothetical protein ABAZ39_03465 [Azospirillum argentinense]EZQ08044.1 hypothetical protein ABAZ39_04890 [Azospirillum argentinense]PNQ94865.1 hypothetical protein C1S70_31910 [Azospirillum argentinense]
MFGFITGFQKGRRGASLQSANQNAYRNMQKAPLSHAANGVTAKRQLEEACVLLQDAADDLESVLSGMPVPAGRADLNEAIGTIMETLRLVASAHARLEHPQIHGGALAD